MITEIDNLILNMQWEQFLEFGKDIDDSVIEEKIKAQKPEHCAVLIYTVSAEKFKITLIVTLHSVNLCSLAQLETLRVL